MKIISFLMSSILFLFSTATIIAQDDFYNDEAIEIYLIDSYVTPELPHRFILSFFTSDSVTSKVKLNGEYEFNVSTEFTDQHVAEFNITKMKFDSTIVPFILTVESLDGKEFNSEKFELVLPSEYELDVEKDLSLFTVCCFGGVVFLLPSPTYVSYQGESYFGLSKEVPIISFFSGGYNYPAGYIGIEYAYIFNAPVKNFIRLGYKQIFELPGIEYISPGLNVYSDFLGYNGISPEVTVGLVRVYNVFTLYSKYRYNFQPGNAGRDMHEISIGLYSNFFSLNF
jgi:hypothetical protein